MSSVPTTAVATTGITAIAEPTACRVAAGVVMWARLPLLRRQSPYVSREGHAPHDEGNFGERNVRQNQSSAPLLKRILS